jgi:two-component system sensor histidine kinase PilS (NtrC family)
MSRRTNVEPTVVVLSPWLEKLLDEYCEIKHIPPQQIVLTSSAPLARICTDEEQLHQVIWNLIDNAWHYADKEQEMPIEIRITLQSENIHIDVIDNGAGVSPQAMEHLFEPFHSERTGGTGLGLYLARELCQANGARLSYLPEFGSCFRISFPLQRQEFIQ